MKSTKIFSLCFSAIIALIGCDGQTVFPMYDEYSAENTAQAPTADAVVGTDAEAASSGRPDTAQNVDANAGPDVKSDTAVGTDAVATTDVVAGTDAAAGSDAAVASSDTVASPDTDTMVGTDATVAVDSGSNGSDAASDTASGGVDANGVLQPINGQDAGGSTDASTDSASADSSAGTDAVAGTDTVVGSDTAVDSNGTLQPIVKADAGSSDSSADAGSTDATVDSSTDAEVNAETDAAASTDSSAGTDAVAETDVAVVVPVCVATTETCDNLDNDCDGQTDEGIEYLYYLTDADADGFGDASAAPLSACATPTGYVVADKDDCNDNAADISPDVTEVCGNGVDDNCDGVTDEGCTVTIKLDGIGTDYDLTVGYELYTSSADIGTGEWFSELPAQGTDTVSVNFGEQNVDFSKVCGIRMNITIKHKTTGAETWLCVGNLETAKLFPGTFFDMTWSGILFTEADLQSQAGIWSAPGGPKAGCSLVFANNLEGKCAFK